MLLETMTVGPIQTCCYIVAPGDGGPAMVIDPGGDADVIISFIESHKLELKYIVNTHGHIDHILANRELKESFPQAEICIHELDKDMLTEPSRNLSLHLGTGVSSPPPDRILSEGDTIELGGMSFLVIHVPGHTPGGICLHYKNPEPGKPDIVFAGDTLFNVGIGRCDLPGGNFKELVENIRRKLFTLDDDTIVLPGHGPATTIGYEKLNNPFF